MASGSFFFDTVKSGEADKKKRNLLDDSGSEDEDGGGAALEPSELKVNEEYAKRFEHNKKREERQRLEEKYKSTKKPKKDGANNDDDDEDDSESSSSEDETEDEAGFLATEELDAQISNVLSAIKNKDPRVRDKNFSFFQAGQEADETPAQKKKDKPLFLKDYQRERILAGDVGGSDEDEDGAEGAPKKPKTYNEEQAALKKSIVSEINKAAEAGGDEDPDAGSDDEDFVKRKHVEKPHGPGSNNDGRSSHADRLDDLTEADVANASKDPELFLSNFMSSRAWAAADGRNWQAFESDDDAEDADHGDRAEEFEQAYNMRFEDPNKSNEVLRSYARDVTDAKSVRRDEATGRKRQRQLEKERKEAERAERREEKARLRRLKIEEAEDKLKKIRQVAGLSGKELKDEDWVKFLDEEWNDAGWEKEMRKRFGDDYYAEDDQDVGNDDDNDDGEEEDGQQKRKRPKKPKWDDDIDINDIVPDFKEDEEPNFTLSDDEAAHNAQGGDDEEEDQEDQEGHRPSKKRKTTKDHKKDRQAAKRASRADRSKIEALVDSRMDLDAGDDPSVEPDSLAAGPSSAKQQRRRAAEDEAGLSFRYRETSPQAFGLTAKDILLAPSDADLNKFAGLKKLATFRDDEKKRKDKKRLGKKARLREWRRETFGRGFERTGPEWEQQQQGVADVKGKKPAAPSRTAASNESRDKPVNPDAGAEGAVEGDGEGQGAKAKRKRSRGKRGKGQGIAAEGE